MLNIITTVSRFVIIFFVLLYCITSVRVLKRQPRRRERKMYAHMIFYIFAIHFVGFLIIFLNVNTPQCLFLYGAEILYLTLVLAIYPLIYADANRALLNHMCFFLAVGSVLLARLNFDKAVKQFIIVAAATVITMIVPSLMKKYRNLYRFKWVYCALGIILLAMVAVMGLTTRGAKLSISLGFITLQPSEFVKVIFVFYVASFLRDATDFKSVVIVTCFAAAFVMILVASTDLGSALVFFVVYIFMLFVATKKSWYLLAGLGAGGAAAVLAYKIFSHIRVRVQTWRNPWQDYAVKGYQVCNSLFALGTGGWFGVGIYKGMPSTIPVIEKDFIFAEIGEELGGLVAIMIIFLCLLTFMVFIQIGMQQKDNFYKLLAVGFGISYAFQVFLTIGGATKMIPLTGVTLPLVSYGGSSALSTIFIFSIMQGLNMISKDEERRAYEQKFLEEE